MTKRKAILELLIADLFWGGAFVAVALAQKVWQSSQISLIRFLIPALIGLSIGFFLKTWRLSKKELILGLIPGFLFAGTIYSQTLGLEFTTPSRSGFITVLYVIFVPLLEFYIQRKILRMSFWLSILGALFGMALMLNLSWSEWNKGDTLTFICALFSAGHIYQVGLLGKKFKHPLLFNLSQCFWAAVFLLPLSFMNRGSSWIPEVWDLTATLALCFIIFGATMIAFSIQARVQMHLDATTSSIIFLLEAPIAMLFSWLLLKESLGPIQIVGALMILFSCVMAIKANENPLPEFDIKFKK